jgi:hypothetical protein
MHNVARVQLVALPAAHACDQTLTHFPLCLFVSL